MHSKILAITEKIKQRSQKSRAAYLDKIANQRQSGPRRQFLSCGNLAHGFAACEANEKSSLASFDSPNLAIVTAYNDMLSAHQPYHNYPEFIKQIAINQGATAQVAGGVPAMCDGVTQGRAGMQLSLFSRDNIAMSTALALSHDMFDGAVYLGICDKIVPGLLIGALSFGHLPGAFIPAGPMGSGIPNKQKAQRRQEYAKGNIGDKELRETESQSYHSPGTCTFYGTANSNQMLMEIMGLQLPGSSFEHPQSELRQPLTAAAVAQTIKNISNNISVSQIVTPESIVNGVIGLLATGGSTNHTIHLIAIARAAGIILNWQDMHELSQVIPLICRVYPNGEADINHFHHAGGMRYVIQELLSNNLLHAKVTTILGENSLENYAKKPEKKADNIILKTSNTSAGKDEKRVAEISWTTTPHQSNDNNIIASVAKPFSPVGGLTLLEGNIGRAVIKTSAVQKQHQIVKAPAKVFHSQQAVIDAFKKNQLNQDFIAVLTFQGPKANGMPELHKLTPILGSLQDQGFQVAFVTDGRMSGASGKVPAAIHLSPEAKDFGNIVFIHDGDIIELNCETASLTLHVSDEELAQRKANIPSSINNLQGMGRELFQLFRDKVTAAEQGATIFELDLELQQQQQNFKTNYVSNPMSNNNE